MLDKSESFLRMSLRYAAIAFLVFVLYGLIHDTVEQENWIRDLQRRIAVLEQQKSVGIQE